jgi:hypothetical protein
MAAPQQIRDQLRELDQRWTEAETEADVSTLDALAADDFALVGPLGFVLDKRQWLDRYRGAELVTHELDFEDPVSRIYDDVAVTIGRFVQRADYQGNPVNGEFRVTRVAVRNRSRWRLAGLHLSPIGGSQPFASGRD